MGVLIAIYSIFLGSECFFVWSNAARAWIVYGTIFFSTPTVSGLKSDHIFFSKSIFFRKSKGNRRET